MENKAPKQGKQVNTYLRFTSVAIQMGAIIGLSAYFGVWLDGKFNPNGKAFTICLSLFGVAAGLYLVIKEVMNLSKEENEK